MAHVSLNDKQKNIQSHFLNVEQEVFVSILEAFTNPFVLLFQTDKVIKQYSFILSHEINCHWCVSENSWM